MSADAEDRFPAVRVADLAVEEVATRWLIEDLWSACAVGLIGGSPKSLKSWLALEMAVSVASGTPCLGRHVVDAPGCALVYLAEDSLAAVRQRVASLARHRDLDLDNLPVHVITAASMRVDLARDQVRLMKTVRAIRPRLLVLDPLVRIHRLDENSSADVSGFLAYLRELQREFDVAIVLVHHTRKNPAPGHAAGQGLRGSGDFHAWSDSGLYLRRQRTGDVLLTVEHRSAPAPKPFALRLRTEESPYLELVEPGEVGGAQKSNLEERVLAALAGTAAQTRARLRERLAVKNERLGRALESLEERQLIERTADGWTTRQERSPFSPIEMRGNGTRDGPNVDIPDPCDDPDQLSLPGTDEIPW